MSECQACDGKGWHHGNVIAGFIERVKCRACHGRGHARTTKNGDNK